MTVIEYAEKRLYEKGIPIYDQNYWVAYLDGAKAQKEESERAVLDDMPPMGGFHDD